MESEAMKRRERLLALKAKTVVKLDPENNQENVIETFPLTEELATVESIAEKILTETQSHPLFNDTLVLDTILPKKVDFDLARLLAEPLKVLEKRTKKAMMEFMKEELKIGEFMMNNEEDDD